MHLEKWRYLLIFAPMKILKKQDLALFGMQLFVWLLLMLAPAVISYFVNPLGDGHWMFFWNSVALITPLMVVYMISYYLLLPLLYYKGHKWGYICCSVLLAVVMNIKIFFIDVSTLDEVAKTGFYSLLAFSITLDVLVMIGAFAFYSYQHSLIIRRQMEEERQKSTEAELNWLKNQLNPHFLFNSLNNISSLTQINPDEAQEAIAQLSDLLRYALYENNNPQVALSGEVEFMHNYISMMKLRCSALTTVEEEMHVAEGSLQVAPLLFISFVENAFKHGTSNKQPSHIYVGLKGDAESLRFVCRNSNFPKSDHDRSGSGVGLENTHRRLELLYAGRYEWQQKVENDVFVIEVTILAHSPNNSTK